MLASSTFDTTPPNGASTDPSTSAEGDRVAFTSTASNLTRPAAQTQHVYLWDRGHSSLSVLSRASASGLGFVGDGPSREPDISSDGRFVAFTSEATNLVDGDTNGRPDVFLRDTVARTTVRVSVSASGGQIPVASGSPAVSGDGRFVAFTTAQNLTPDDRDSDPDVYLRDMVTGSLTLRSLSGQATAATEVDLADDGRVAFVSTDGSSIRQVFTRPLAGPVTLVSRRIDAMTPANGASHDVTISRTGAHVGFTSAATDLVSGDTNGRDDAFLSTVGSAEVARVSVANDGSQADAGSFQVRPADEGRIVAFGSLATNLVPGDTNQRSDVFVHRRP